MKFTKMYSALQSLQDFRYAISENSVIEHLPTNFEFELSWYFRLFRERILRRTNPYNPNYFIQYPTRRLTTNE